MLYMEKTLSQTVMLSFIKALAWLQEHLDLVRTDFQFVFKDILNLDHFERAMFFSDPISKFTFFRGKVSWDELTAHTGQVSNAVLSCKW